MTLMPIGTRCTRYGRAMQYKMCSSWIWRSGVNRHIITQVGSRSTPLDTEGTAYGSAADQAIGRTAIVRPPNDLMESEHVTAQLRAAVRRSGLDITLEQLCGRSDEPTG